MVSVAYVNIHVLRDLKEELAWAIDTFRLLVICIMVAIPLRKIKTF